MNRNLVLLEALALADARGNARKRGALLVEFPETPGPARPLGCEILATGSPEEVASHPMAAAARRVDLGRSVIHPGLVNAHTHLDLTHIGPKPHDPARGFTPWIRMILSERANDADAIRESVRLGINRSLAGGVIAVGDIAGVGRLEPVEALRASPLIGVSFVELFGLAENTRRSATASFTQRLESTPLDSGGVRIGVQPHAPYSASPALYKDCVALHRDRGLPLSTHLAESPAEHELVSESGGPFQSFLASLGVWSDDVASLFGSGDTPVGHLQAAFEQASFLIAHLNDLSDSDMEIIASGGHTLAYCPRSSRYFGNDDAFGPHRYKELIERGVDVCLGTDSIVNLPSHGDLPPMSTLDEARILHRDDGTDAHLLMAMMTTHGARALGLPESWFDLSPGPCAGLASVLTPEQSDDLGAFELLLKGGAPRLLLSENCPCNTGIV